MWQLERKLSPVRIMETSTIHGKWVESYLAEYPSGALFLIAGIVSEAEGKSTEFGIATRFRGEFVAIRAHDRKEFRSGQMFLPAQPTDMILHGMAVKKPSSKPGEDWSDPVQGEVYKFAFMVGVKKSDSTIGFEYTLSTLQKPVESNPLSELLASQIAALPAPETKIASIQAPATETKIASLPAPATAGPQSKIVKKT